ncbi:MAG: hypothetical protein H7061_06580 [Bdellovibrionaceae bacterium]|nr:hypothetical protein [Bdellovibrio sp.]
MQIFFLLSAFFFAGMSNAGVVQVNKEEAIVYFLPTPTIELNLMDLGREGGVLNVSSDYNGAATEGGLGEVKRQYAGYEVKLLNAAYINSSVMLNLPSVGFVRELKLRQGQMGPYLNASFELTASEVLKFKRSAEDIKSRTNLNLKVQVSYFNSSIVEKYSTDERFCPSLKANTIAEVVSALLKLERPAAIKYAQTFSSLKMNALQSCFEIEGQAVSSFAQLLQSRTITKTGVVVSGVYAERKAHDENVEVRPFINVIVN